MNKVDIQSRLDQAMTQREQLKQQLTQVMANISAYNGAIEALTSLVQDFDKDESIHVADSTAVEDAAAASSLANLDQAETTIDQN